ncbi:hypothetical protein [Pseudomonas serbica]|uniref:hypothetical protein n=1 Tax=Pseudomonas serbica TaxID=2965074 RepID=UPI00237BBB9F|nr:hypothetical protein [Pseudomonas serbica]
MTDEKPESLPRLPPISKDEIHKLLNDLKTSQGQFAKDRPPVVLVGNYESTQQAIKLAEMADPWLKDSILRGPALQAAASRYRKVFYEAGGPNSSVEKGEVAMAAAIGLYVTLVADLQYRDDQENSRKQPSPAAEASKGLRVAAAYHRHQAQTFLEEEGRLLRIYESHGDMESREMAKDASDKAKMHLDAGVDMLLMAIGNAPECLDDAFGAFEKARAKILG